MGQKIPYSDKSNNGDVKYPQKDRFVLNDVSEEELEKRRISVYSYLL
ncbi:hypothetical protein [uncultured Prevotella sp.]|nr:hypothetical protein [uncultured Prevotella sp.]